MSRVVMALGGNALGNTPEEQKLKTRWIAKVIADMVEDGHHLVICHGNGPQVGLSLIHICSGDATGNTPDQYPGEKPYAGWRRPPENSA